jgi:hypothetical protein
MIQEIEPPLIVCFILNIWFNSNAFVEYVNFFNVGFCFHTYEYQEKQKENPQLTYINYLKIYHDSFYVRLITCPLCLSIWLNLSVCLIFINFSSFFFNAWLSLFLFYTLSIFIKKYND